MTTKSKKVFPKVIRITWIAFFTFIVFQSNILLIKPAALAGGFQPFLNDQNPTGLSLSHNRKLLSKENQQ